MQRILLPSAILTFSMLFRLTDAHAQLPILKNRISGKIRTETKIPLPPIILNLYQVADSLILKSITTNDKGEFLLESIPEGTYLLSAEGPGYEKLYHGPFTIKKNIPHAEIHIELTLHKNIHELNTVTINSRKPLVERRNNKTILNVANSTIASGNSAMDILAKAPGVSIDHDGNISLKGKSGILVTIDDKQTYLSGTQLADYLRSTNGNAIQLIELISNPSAKYDAAGSAGIINIKMKKNSNYGTNGSVMAGGGYGSFYKSNADINFNERDKNLNIFGSYQYNNNRNFEELILDRSSGYDADQTFFHLREYDVYTRKNNSYKVGTDYSINNRHIIGFIVNGYHHQTDVDASSRTLIGSHPGQQDSSVTASNPTHHKTYSMAYNLNYKSMIDTSGQEVNVDIDYSRFNSNNETISNNFFYNSNGNTYKPPFIFKNATPSSVRIWAAKLDYTYPLSKKIKLETGLKSSYVYTDNEFQFQHLVGNHYLNDPLQSNQFKYKEYINAAYINMYKEFRSTKVQVGVRSEHSHTEGNSVTIQQQVKRKYIDFFPNISVHQQLSEHNEIGISLSRRIDRPNYHSLNPFIYYADLYTFYQGNPFLNPQYTNLAELSYSFRKTMNLTLSYSRTTDVITTALISDPIKKTLYINDQNLAQEKNISLNINRAVKITRWWNTENDVTLYHNHFSSPNLMGTAFMSAKFTWLANMVQTFRLHETVNAELSLNYHSTQVYGTYAIKPLYSIDAGLSKSFLNNKANIKFAAADIFNLMKPQISSTVPLQDYRLSQKQESRIFRLTFTYNFGNGLVKAARERLKGSETEQNRVQSGN